MKGGMVGGIVALVVVIILIVLLSLGYVKAPPDMAFIISRYQEKVKGCNRQGKHQDSVL